MKVALVHYWLVRMRGGEKVLEQFCTMFPDADIFTHVVDADRLSPEIRKHRIHTSFINRLPLARTRYQDYLPLMPMALEQMDLGGYDLVISSESGPAKGVLVPPEATHVCYCHTPMRYLWNMYPFYRRNTNALRRALMGPLTHYLRMWDRLSADRVDSFIANSDNTGRRIRRYYNRPSTVVHPPVDVDRFTVSPENDGFYLLLGQMIPYKRFDIAIEAFNRLGLPLHVVGEGSEARGLRAAAKPNIKFFGWVDADQLHDKYSRCKALIFPGEEDFGIVPVEAMASGKPVIAYGCGGALETVVPGKTGILFEEQSADALCEAVQRFEARARDFDPASIADFAARFSPAAFRARMFEAIEQAVEAKAAAEAGARTEAARRPTPLVGVTGDAPVWSAFPDRAAAPGESRAAIGGQAGRA